MKTSNVTGYTTVPTDLGQVGLAWSALGLARVFLPGENEEAPDRVMASTYGPDRRSEQAPEPLLPLVEAIQAHMEGKAPRYEGIPLDLSQLTPFTAAVYEATRRIPPGKARTYGAVAHALGKPNAARAVGMALSRNPFPLVVPCHRVLAQDGSLRGFTAPGGIETKRRLLENEGFSFCVKRPRRPDGGSPEDCGPR